MKAQELREKSSEELAELLEQLEDMQFRLRLQHYTGQLKRVSSLGASRKEIARVRTVLNERETLSRVKARLGELEDDQRPGTLRADLSGNARRGEEFKQLRRQRKQLSRIVGEV